MAAGRPGHLPASRCRRTRINSPQMASNHARNPLALGQRRPVALSVRCRGRALPPQQNSPRFVPILVPFFRRGLEGAVGEFQCTMLYLSKRRVLFSPAQPECCGCDPHGWSLSQNKPSTSPPRARLCQAAPPQTQPYKRNRRRNYNAEILWFYKSKILFLFYFEDSLIMISPLSPAAQPIPVPSVTCWGCG